jgi:hypothetical protein
MATEPSNNDKQNRKGEMILGKGDKEIRIPIL